MALDTAIIGLDGASFNLLARWLDNGELPNLKQLIKTGVKSDLVSCPPPVTSPNWKCYTTGQNPGKLGIFWWENIDVEERKVNFPRERVQKNKEYWDYLNEEGLDVGVINTPLTFPPRDVEKFMVAGGPDAEGDGFTYPEGLEAELKEKFDYKVHPRLLSFIKDGSSEEQEEAIKELHEIIQSRFQAAKWLIDEYDIDLLHLTIFYINTLHHFFWDEEHVKVGWKIIDKGLGSISDDAENIILMSDHGSNPIEQIFYINSWLEQEGYLKLKKRSKLPALMYNAGLEQDRLLRIAEKAGIRDFLTEIVPQKLVSYIPSEAGTIDKSGKTDKIDWENSRAVASGQGPVYLIDRDPKLKKELKKKINDLSNPETGKRVSEEVYERDDIYSGEFTREGPDLVIEQAPGTHIRGGISIKNDKVFEGPKGWRAENRRKGIFVASGENFVEGREVADVSMMDIAPTILKLYGVNVPPSMDGKPIQEALN